MKKFMLVNDIIIGKLWFVHVSRRFPDPCYSFLCGKHFPLRSRPVLNSHNSRLFEDYCRNVHGDSKDADDADVW